MSNAVINQRAALGFRIVRVLGQGSGSVVFETMGEANNRFALKYILRETPEVDPFIEQSGCEYEASQRFDHPSIRKVHRIIRKRAFATGLGDMFRSRSPMIISEAGLVMELIEGTTLADFPTNHIGRVCQLLLEVADGLAVIHKAGYVHCEIKPNNIMTTREGKVKIIDLGLVCLAGTVRNWVHHTPGYIAPEQVNHQKLTPQTDIFSFGATMYRMLTGGTIPLKTVEGEKVYSPREQNPMVPPALSALVMECISRKPEQRPGAISEVHERLRMAVAQLRK